MTEITDLKTDWTHRRIVIFIVVIVMSLFLLLALLGAVWLAFLFKFSVLISTFITIFTICSFFSLLAVVGSYVFGAAWSDSNFLQLIPEIMPHLKKDDDQCSPPSQP